MDSGFSTGDRFGAAGIGLRCCERVQGKLFSTKFRVVEVGGRALVDPWHGELAEYFAGAEAYDRKDRRAGRRDAGTGGQPACYPAAVDHPAPCVSGVFEADTAACGLWLYPRNAIGVYGAAALFCFHGLALPV